jgi:diaminopimelate dehydrogenase
MQTRKIRIGLAGYGILGRGLEKAVALNPDLEPAVILTRRDPAERNSAFGRAVARMAGASRRGAIMVFDGPFAQLSPKSPEQLRQEML